MRQTHARSDEPFPQDARQDVDAEALTDALTELLERAHEVPPDRLPELGEQVAAGSGVRTTRLWLVDYGLRRLLPFGEPASRESFEIEGTVAGRAYLLGQPIELEQDDGVALWAPLVDGINRIGVARFEADHLDAARRGTLANIAAVLASEIVVRGQYTDAMAQARRTTEMTLAAELLWDLLRPFSFATPEVSIAASTELAYQAAGDAYDYAYNDGVLHAAVIDAIGHDLNAALIANLAIVTCRWCRRRGVDIEETSRTVDATIAARYRDGEHATGILARLDVRTGVLRWINNGHPPPLLIRDDRVVGEFATAPRPPWGIQQHARSSLAPVSELALQPNDRIFLYTDGIVEARVPNGEPFGLARLETFLHRALASGLPNSEIVRRLAHAVVDHHDGALNDDATTLLIYWHPYGV